MNFSSLRTILVAFSPETPEFTLSTIAPFAAIRQKSVYHAKYLRMSLTYLDLPSVVNPRGEGSGGIPPTLASVRSL